MQGREDAVVGAAAASCQSRRWGDGAAGVATIDIPDEEEEALAAALERSTFPATPQKEGNAREQRLARTLEVYGAARERKVRGDGNCQFRALADQLFGSEREHKVVRAAVAKQLESHREEYQNHVSGGSYDAYVKRISLDGGWGDHVSLQAAADAFAVQVNVISSFKERPLMELLPRQETPRRTVCLTFRDESHYNSVELLRAGAAA